MFVVKGHPKPIGTTETRERHAQRTTGNCKFNLTTIIGKEYVNWFATYKQGTSPNGHSSLHNEMDCDDEFAEDRLDLTEQIVKEAKSVYNQLKMLHTSLNSNQDVDSGLHSDLFLGGSSSSPGSDDLRQGMLSSITDDIVNLVMGLDVVQLKTLLEQSRASCMDQDDELRRRSDVILELECKVKETTFNFLF